MFRLFVLITTSEESLLVGGTTLPAEEDTLLVGEAYNLADLEGILLAGEGRPPGRRGCTTLPARRESSWSTRLYNLADQEDSLQVSEVVRLADQEGVLLGRRGCTADQEGFLLVDV
ncbi:hypothetical protein PGTUg99_012369 [Puccinia graminis f. sp. tritici]|uniref:Uncharacterized protein n=1 Tax=Puccinia graminis f. sp. tritici TaxID=56615 RepID=A0A5B0NVD8_PUCGR|nr:hypothetical protein PGTUg99_012369 [Puccinia graminis f. sp. tritici]